MGQYFYYANLDREEYFSVGLGHQTIKRSGIGRGLGARALGLLLAEHAPVSGLSGSWSGQRVMVVGDETPDGLYETMRAGYHDIESAVLLMLFADDASALLGAAADDDTLFVHLAELALVHGAANLAAALEDRFGSEWKKRYGARRKEMPHLVIPPP